MKYAKITSMPNSRRERVKFKISPRFRYVYQKIKVYGLVVNRRRDFGQKRKKGDGVLFLGAAFIVTCDYTVKKDYTKTSRPKTGIYSGFRAACFIRYYHAFRLIVQCVFLQGLHTMISNYYRIGLGQMSKCQSALKDSQSKH